MHKVMGWVSSTEEKKPKSKSQDQTGQWWRAPLNPALEMQRQADF